MSLGEGDLKLGIIGTSRKADERRLPILPSQLPQIPEALRRRIFVQQGYGARLGVPDEEILPLVGGMLETDALFETCDVVLLAKPTAGDFPLFRPGQTIWGWPHCVQNEDITQQGIDKKLTYIAWESMNLWPAEGVRGLHVFHQNNEIAGYAAVLHAFGLLGQTGHYGPPLRAAVIHFGLTGRGALRALLSLGVREVTCFTLPPPEDVPAQMSGVTYRQLARADDTQDAVVRCPGRIEMPLSEELAQHDVIVNCIFQDTDAPLFFLRSADLGRLRRGTLIVDVSCDRGLGFEFARPTSFRDPTFTVGDEITYYAVDHTPSHLWRSASWEIGKALLPYVPVVMGGPDAWDANDVIRHAIEVRDGVILNPKILSRQAREAEYPHVTRP